MHMRPSGGCRETVWRPMRYQRRYWRCRNADSSRVQGPMSAENCSFAHGASYLRRTIGWGPGCQFAGSCLFPLAPVIQCAALQFVTREGAKLACIGSCSSPQVAKTIPDEAPTLS